MTNTENKTPRTTKAMRYADIKVLLTGEGTIPDGRTTLDDAIAFINAELDLLAKKNANKGNSKKEKEKAEADARYMAEIMEFMENRADDSGLTCTAIGQSIPSLVNAGYGTSKFSSLCNTLVKDGRLNKAVVKGRTLFSLA